jgi:hypothetical protein
MALLSKAKPGRVDGGYTRLLGNSQVGALISQVHAASISAGTELEKMVAERINNMTSEHFSDFINNKLALGTYLMTKKLIKNKLQSVIGSWREPDFLIFSLRERRVYAVELKDGDTFDTKKASGEISSYQEFTRRLSSFFLERNLDYEVAMRVCCFNQNNKTRIIDGFKKQLQKSEAWTGEEFCQKIGLSYAEIIRQRQDQAQENLAYFIQELLKIDVVQEVIRIPTK